MKLCSICGCEFAGHGNNPHPFPTDQNQRCCDECDNRFVIPMRIIAMNAHYRQNIPEWVAFLTIVAKLGRTMVQTVRVDKSNEL